MANRKDIERDNRFGQHPEAAHRKMTGGPWGDVRPDRSLDPTDDPRIPHPNTMGDPGRAGRAFLISMAFVSAVTVIGLGYLAWRVM